MSDSLTTVATFEGPMQAALARNRLQAAGIKSFLPGESVVSMAWHLTTAVGGIRLQVAAEDAERAHAILAETAPEVAADSADNDGDDAASAGVDASEPESSDEYTQLTVREQTADRAFRGAVIGLLFLPLQIYVFWLLLKVFFSNQQLSPRFRTRAIVAAVINLPFVFAIVLWLAWASTR